jgi:hypothetical protein
MMGMRAAKNQDKHVLGVGHSRKRLNQSRAAATSCEIARFESGGGAGSDVAEHWFVRC